MTNRGNYEDRHTPTTTEKINSTAFPRSEWLEKELADNPNHPTNMFLTKRKDLLLDRNCVILDGKCDCPRLEGNSFPECKRLSKT